MQIIRDTTEFVSPGETAVSIGKFDGVHLGHRRLLEELLDQKEKGLLAAVFTFDPYPEVFFGFGSKQILTTREEKEQIFEKMGIDLLVEFPFNAKSAATPSREFVSNFLCKQMRARFIAAGPDLSFGDHGSGNFALLEEMAPEYGFKAKKIEKIIMDDNVVSSTLIRRLIETGEMESATKFLGHPHVLTGRVLHGQKLGRKLGVPTANLEIPSGVVVPKFGVYACKANIDGKSYPAVANVGIRPTVSGSGITVEPWILDFSGNLYGKEITLEFYRFLREETKFPDLTALQRQIHLDAAETRRYFETH